MLRDALGMCEGGLALTVERPIRTARGITSQRVTTLRGIFEPLWADASDALCHVDASVRDGEDPRSVEAALRLVGAVMASRAAERLGNPLVHMLPVRSG